MSAFVTFLTVVLSVCASVAHAQGIVVDLARTDNVSQRIDPGSVSVRFSNRLPQSRYDVSVRLELIPVEAFSIDAVGSLASLGRLRAESSVAPCDVLVAATKRLNDATAENQVPARVLAVRDLLARKDCPTPGDLADANAALSGTMASTAPRNVRAGERLTITVTRQVATGTAPSWTVVLETEPRGE